jgi:hypothetical protein
LFFNIIAFLSFTLTRKQKEQRLKGKRGGRERRNQGGEAYRRLVQFGRAKREDFVFFYLLQAEKKQERFGAR